MVDDVGGWGRLAPLVGVKGVASEAFQRKQGLWAGDGELIYAGASYGLLATVGWEAGEMTHVNYSWEEDITSPAIETEVSQVRGLTCDTSCTQGAWGGCALGREYPRLGALVLNCRNQVGALIRQFGLVGGGSHRRPTVPWCCLTGGGDGRGGFTTSGKSASKWREGRPAGAKSTCRSPSIWR